MQYDYISIPSYSKAKIDFCRPRGTVLELMSTYATSRAPKGGSPSQCAALASGSFESDMAATGSIPVPVHSWKSARRSRGV